jgi:hypothetical protein
LGFRKKGVSAPTEVTSAKNKIALSMNFAPPGIQLLDETDRDIQAVSHSLSSVLVRKDGKGEEISRKDPDFSLAARPVAQTKQGGPYIIFMMAEGLLKFFHIYHLIYRVNPK